MSDFHSNFPNNGGRQRDRLDDNSGGEKNWNDFESCAQFVARLYSEPSWKNFQGAAEGTTQLYKTSVDNYRRGFDKGFHSGRTHLAKEIIGAFQCSSAFNLNTVLEILYRNMRLPNEEGTGHDEPFTFSHDTDATMQLFQRALTDPPNVTNGGEQQRNAPKLDAFLESQVQRHRKRQRSPGNGGSPGGHNKRQRRL
ncbi:unnamed protein product [Caenorhabditis bovis]|uniref:Uncharacterized protein n=1 Tax=Caenorhabditis bovis TaxID=2654633 RepID=A0A8S1F8R6_9PELO|nr:unnamed protein product [Caenorhabditis bovis]